MLVNRTKSDTNVFIGDKGVLLSKIDKILMNSGTHKCSFKPRKIHIAVLLSICPGLGQQYAGHLYRGILFYITLIIVSWLAAIAFMYVKSTHVSLIILFVPIILFMFIVIDAIYCALKQPKDYKLKWYNKSWLYIGVFAFLLSSVNPLMDMLIGSNIVRAYFVTSKSMSPTILLHDLVLINKLKKPEKSDIVLIGYGDNQYNGSISNVIKDQTLRRIIAVPGDKVEVRGNKVFVNSEELQEAYVNDKEIDTSSVYTDMDYTWGPGTVPENSFYVLSDSRQYSFDSRVIGFIGQNQICGIASKIFWSWNYEEGTIKWSRTAMSIN